MPSTRALALVVLLAGGGAVVVGGCSRIMGTTTVSEPISRYPDGPSGLKQLFEDVLKAAKADDRPRVHDLFQSLKMSRGELDGLFGARAAELASPYEEMMATLIHRGAVEIVAVIYEKKYDTVEVVPVELSLSGPDAGEPTYGPLPRPDDAALARNLRSPPPIYAVRLTKRGEPGATRYNFLFFSDGHWRTGNELGRLLAKRDDLTGSPSPR